MACNKPIQTINPASGQPLHSYSQMSEQQIETIIEQSHAAFLTWRKTSFAHRSKKMHKLAELLIDKKAFLADLMTQEMGKVNKEAIGEIEKCAWVCRYYADNAEAFLADQSIAADMAESFVSYQPIGIVLAVMPWNFPFWQVFRFAAPCLMAGNVGLLKHASSVTGCALAIEKLIEEAGFTDHVFKTLVIASDKVEAIINHPKVRAVTLTGSTAAGSKVAAQAAKQIKKSVLELGGSDPYLVLEDADIKLAAEKCCQSRMINAGQSCIAAKRFIVLAGIYDEFVQAFTEQMKNKKMGEPMDDASDYGPQANQTLRDELHQQVVDSVKAGARCILGGEIPDKHGAWYPATILVDVKPGMPAYQQELFGPVAVVIKAQDIKEAIRIANDSEFGLGGAIFSNNIELARQIARDKMDTGTVAINDFVKSDPRLPFGGVKTSGYGRELSEFGIKEFVNIKTICRS
ncbi:NAD-dependent succinate-semialdehyde dehydrogenase [Catenovulum sp. 2E275]|uniref:NAD-dependent succinate-semialdehyde dehydrogenase n=1 Tax=Catenovulum sp. 2E275 TaxID=2980497 RepID=UPI0021D084BB|nr:NAD-dependent succinate-semialdehyde dehydrogenase [Catenovulum sp. 2E275]MCU4677175.1 NAD-dependent succinate-semialdehyde dehydrogenase [Catenovulum sp. 2E275]